MREAVNSTRSSLQCGCSFFDPVQEIGPNWEGAHFLETSYIWYILVFENSQHAMERNYGAVAHRRTHVHKETEFLVTV